MWVTLALCLSASLWSRSFCTPLDKVDPGANQPLGDILDQLVDDIFNNYKPTDSFPIAMPSEDVVESILKSIETYHKTTDFSTFTNNTNKQCGESARVAVLEKLINSIFTSIKNYKENIKNTNNSTNTTHQSNGENPVTTNDSSNTPVPVNCTCVAYYKCNDTTDTDELLPIRITEYQCQNYLDVCCRNIVDIEEPTKSTTLVTPAKAPAPTVETPKPKPLDCGLSSILSNGAQASDSDDRAKNGEFPWMVWIGDSTNTYLCGGSLIHPKVVLTAAHCVNKKENLIIRAGDFNAQSNTKEESLSRQEVKVEYVVVHEKFNDGSLANDPALLILQTPVQLSERVGLICLTQQLQENVDGDHCIASGWGNQLKSNESEEEKGVLKRVGPLPIVPRGKCQDSLRKTKLGEHFKLHETFLCAGGNPGKDTCKGDGGSPLVCPSLIDPLVYVQVGVVAWGISCGTDTPGVYVNVPHFLPWIREELKVKGIETYF